MKRIELKTLSLIFSHDRTSAFRVVRCCTDSEQNSRLMVGNHLPEDRSDSYYGLHPVCLPPGCRCVIVSRVALLQHAVVLQRLVLALGQADNFPEEMLVVLAE